jgi:hypothetical protein
VLGGSLSLFSGASTTPCDHTFCHECIVSAMASQRRCPVCKAACSKRQLKDNEQMCRFVALYRRLLKNDLSHRDPDAALVRTDTL